MISVRFLAFALTGALLLALAGLVLRGHLTQRPLDVAMLAALSVLSLVLLRIATSDKPQS